MLKKELIVMGILALSSTIAFAPTTPPPSSPDMHMFQAAWQKRFEQSTGNTFLDADASKQAEKVSSIISNAADGKMAPERMRALGLVDEKGELLSGPALKARAAFLDQAVQSRRKKNVSEPVKINPMLHVQAHAKATIHPTDHTTKDKSIAAKKTVAHSRSPLRATRNARPLRVG